MTTNKITATFFFLAKVQNYKSHTCTPGICLQSATTRAFSRFFSPYQIRLIWISV